MSIAGAIRAASGLTDRAIAALAVVSTSVRLVTRGVVRIEELPASAALAIGVETRFVPVLGWAVGWVFYGVVFYRLLPRVYPGEAGSVLERDRAVRTAVTAVTVGFGMLVERWLLPPGISGTPLPAIDASWSVWIVAAVGPLLVGVFFLRARESFGATDGFVDSTVGAYVGGDAPSGPPVPDAVAVPVATALLAVAFAWITALLGFVAAAASALFPGAELLLLLVWLLSEAFPRLDDASVDRADVEHRLAAVAFVARFGLKGLFGVVLPLVGVALGAAACMLVLGGIVLLVQGSGTAGGPLTAQQWLIAVSAIAGIGLYGAYSLWYWLRILDRMPTFVAAWAADRRGVPDQAAAVESAGLDGRFRACPPDLLALPTGMLLALAVVAPLALPATLLVVPTVAAFGWGIYRSVRWTIAREQPQPAIGDNWRIPAAFLVSVGGYSLLYHRVAVRGLAAGELGALRDLLGTWTLLATLVGSLFYFGDVHSMLDAPEARTRRLGLAGGLLLTGLLCGTGLLYGDVEPSQIAGVAVVLSALWGVLYYF